MDRPARPQVQILREEVIEMGLFNPGTGRPHSETKRLNQLRDREQAKLAKSNREAKQRIQRAQSRRKAGSN